MWGKSFPNLQKADYRVTSEATPQYNCIAWAAGENGRWWWPDPMVQAYWPADIPREATLEAFVQVYAKLGYRFCESGELEPAYEKIALFALSDGVPTHAARQLRNGNWTSKLGTQEDIEHSLKDLEGPQYGAVVRFLRRPFANTR